MSELTNDPAANGEGRITAEEAKAALLQVQKQKIQQCGAEVQQVLDRHSCRIEAICVLSNRGPQMQIQIVPVEQ